MSRVAAPLSVLGVGVVVFALAYAGLRLAAAVGSAVPGATPTTGAVMQARAPDSLTTRIRADQVAVGVPTSGWEPLFKDVRSGDRVNVLASIPATSATRPLTAVVVSGATVLEPPSAGGALLLGVPTSDALVLGHLVMGGTPLAYVVWPANGAPPESEPLDEATARRLLGLAPREAALPPPPTPTPASLAPTAVPAQPTPEPQRESATSTPEPTPRPLPDRYVVEPGDTLSGIAAELGVDEGALWWANRHLVDPGYLMPGMELVVPTFRGFMYQVRPGDSWFALSRRFGLSPEYLRQRNELPDDAPLEAGTRIFVPLSP